MANRKNRVLAAILAVLMFLTIAPSAFAKPGDPGDPIKSFTYEAVKHPTEYNTWWVKYYIEAADDKEVVPTNIVVIMDYSLQMNYPPGSTAWNIASKAYTELVNTVMGFQYVDNKLGLVMMGSEDTTKNNPNNVFNGETYIAHDLADKYSKNDLLAALPAGPVGEMYYLDSIDYAYEVMKQDTDSKVNHMVIFLTTAGNSRGGQKDKDATLAKLTQWKGELSNLQFKAVGIGAQHDASFLEDIAALSPDYSYIDCSDEADIKDVISGFADSTITTVTDTKLTAKVGKGFQVIDSIDGGGDANEISTNPYGAKITGDPKVDGQTVVFEKFAVPKDEITELKFKVKYIGGGVPGTGPGGGQIDLIIEGEFEYDGNTTEGGKWTVDPNEDVKYEVNFVSEDKGTLTGTTNYTLEKSSGYVLPVNAIPTPVPHDTSVKFAGWKSSNDSTNKLYSSAEVQNMMFEINTTFTGVYKDSVWEVSYYLSGGSYTAAVAQKFEYDAVEDRYFEEVSHNGTAIQTTNPTPPTGYRFEGWQKYDENNTPVGSTISSTVVKNAAVTKDTKYAAVYVAKDVSVKFVPNGGSMDGSTATKTVPMKYNDVIGTEMPITMLRSGYSFAGWKRSTDNIVYSANDVKDQTVPDITTLTYTAQWAGDQVALTFDPNGGVNTTPASGTISSNIGSNLLANSVKDPTPPVGKVFVNWKDSTNATFTSAQFDNKLVSGAETYTAQYSAKKYTVTFNPNGGTLVGANGSYTNVEHGNLVSTLTPALQDATSNGKTFKHWTKDEAGTYTSAQVMAHAVEGDVTYKAVYDDNSYVVKFEKGTNGELDPSMTANIATQSVIHNASPTGVKDAAATTGYTFTGWKANGASTVVSTADVMNNTKTKITGNTTFVAQYEINKYTVTFNANGGTLVGTNGSYANVEHGNLVNTLTPALQDATSNGKTFKHWTKDGAGTYTSAQVMAHVVEGNVTYKAVYDDNSYVVKFEKGTNGELDPTMIANIATQSVIHNASPTGVKDAAATTGYTFTGWKANGASTVVSTADVMNNTKTKITGNTTFVAQYEINKYTVTFNANGGTLVGTNGSYANVEHGNLVNTLTPALQDATSNGKTFKHWTKDGAGTYTSAQVMAHVVEGNVTYKAVYDDNSYVVKFEKGTNGELDPTMIANIATQSVIHNASPTGVKDAAATTGYTFTGWKANGASTVVSTADVMNNTKTKIIGNTTFVAQYEIIKYEVKFELAGGTLNAGMTSPQTIAIPF